MGNHETIKYLIAGFSGQDNIISAPKLYVRYTGDITSAILLNQIVFFSDKSKRTDGFFYKSYKEWEEESCLSERQVRYAAKKLKDMGIIDTKLMKANGAPTVHYKLLFDKFAESILTFCQNGNSHNVRIEPDNMSESLTDITTDITTDVLTTTPQAVEKPLIQFFEEELMIRLSPMQMQKTLSYADDFFDGDKVVRHAITLAADKNKKNFAFVEFLLRDWLNNKAESLNSVLAYEKEKFGKVTAGRSNYQKSTKPNLDQFRD
jgi:DnaD/phage-associated family protein